MDTPSAMRLGPMIEEISTPLVIRGFPTTSSGVGRSMTGSGGRLTPIWYDSPGIAVDIAPPPSGAATIVCPMSSASKTQLDRVGEDQRRRSTARTRRNASSGEPGVDPLLGARPAKALQDGVAVHAQRACRHRHAPVGAPPPAVDPSA